MSDLWGKLAQRSGRTSVTLFGKDTMNDFLRLLTDPSKQIVSWTLLGPDPEEGGVAAIEWRQRKRFEPEPSGNSIYTPVFTTSYGRIHLYEALSKIGAGVAYADTDSCLYSCVGPPAIEPKSVLGGWENEIPDGERIQRFTATGCKSYSYQTSSGRSVTRVKGFTLTHANAGKINYNSMLKLVTSEEKDVVNTTNPSRITRDMHNYVIYNVKEVKKFTYQNDKRVFKRDYSSLPYGY